MSKSIWVEGMITERSNSAYLIERVRVAETETDYIWWIEFRRLRDWRVFKDRCYSPRIERLTVREPTDEEYALIAKRRLLGD